MKRKALLVLVLAVASCTLAAHVFRMSRGTAAAPGPEPLPSLLMVEDLRERPGEAGSEVTVLGFVGGTNQEEGLFALVDTREVERCGTVECADFLLPVSWHGEMPVLGEMVTVRGYIEQSEKGLRLAATEIQK